MASSFVIDATKAAALERPHHQKEIIRRDAKFHPTVWGDYFIQFSETVIEPSPQMVERMDTLKKELRTLLKDENLDIGLIDWIQRVGISYHFEKDITEALERVYKASSNANPSSYQFSDLYPMALHFRLLRQQRYLVSTDMFKRFMDTTGKFKENICNDIEGLLSLYEASYMSVKGEVILDQALDFASEKLKAALPNLKGSLAQQVECALELPLQRCTQKLKTRRSISCYESKKGRNDAVLELAKLDFNVQQAMHRKELAEITRWYKELDVARKLSFGRDRIVELYFWILECFPESQYSRARNIMTKWIVTSAILDDLYDTYGTYEELQLFTSAIEKCDAQVLEQLPDCIKHVYDIVSKVFKETEQVLNLKELHRIGYLRQMFLPFLKSFLTEAKWFYSQYSPTFKEYSDNALVSCGYPFLTVVALTGMDEIATKDVFEWAIKTPSIVHAASIICRNRDDIVGHTNEQEKGDVPTGVECYMKEHGCSKDETCKALQALVDDAWKQINYELLHNSVIPSAILMRVAGLARVISVLYENDRDGFSDSRFETKDRISLVLVEAIPI